MKQRYRQLCSNEPSISLFSKDWWLDAVCGEDNWDVAVYEENGKIVGSMPYYMKSKWGFRGLIMPKLTQSMGVWIRRENLGKNVSIDLYEKKIINNLIDLLPPFDYFIQNVHYSLTNWQPFYWRGFSQTTRYTHIIKDISDPEAVYSCFSREKKQNIRKAEGIYNVYVDNNVEKFFGINEMVFKRQGMEIPYTLDTVKRLDEACEKRECRMVLFAEDAQGRLGGAAYLVWDEGSSYNLMVGTDPGQRSSYPGVLLVWEAIKRLSGVVKNFDFEGSMIKSIAKFNCELGAESVPYFQLMKYNSTLLKLFKEFHRRIKLRN